jgi:SAM-dependent methyltransferase
VDREPVSGDDARADRERAFHDDLYSRRSRAALDPYYSLLGSSTRFYSARVLADCTGKKVLEIGCGEGSIAVALAQSGAIVEAIDISPVAITSARRTALPQNANVMFRVMGADTLDYPDAFFDLVCGRSILHHLPLDRAVREIRRVLKPEGSAVFLEPLAHNPLINLIRRLTPQLRSPDEQPLSLGDLRAFRREFLTVTTDYFHLASLFALPLRGIPGARHLGAFLEAADRLLLSTPLRRYAWMAVVTLSEPKKDDAGQTKAAFQS